MKFLTNIALWWINRVSDKESKQRILSEAVQHLYKCISADDILRVNQDGSWSFMGRKLMGSDVSQLKNEAQFIREMRLWKMIRFDIRYQIGKKIWEDGRIGEDLLWGQLLTFLDDIIKTRINTM